MLAGELIGKAFEFIGETSLKLDHGLVCGSRYK